MGIFERIVFKLFMISAGLAPMILFCWQLKRRNMFWLRIVTAIAVCVGLDFLSEAISFKGLFWLHCIYNIAVFISISLLMWICFQESYFTVLFCCIAGKCTMHVAEYLNSIIYVPFNRPPIVYISIVLYSAIYVAMYFFLARKIKRDECAGLKNIRIIIFAFITLAVTDILVMGFQEQHFTKLMRVSIALMVIIVCLLILSMQFGFLAESKLKRETEAIKQLRAKEQEQYSMSQDTARLIGIKHHDIKNMLESCKGKLTEEELDKLGKQIDNYEIKFNTGNATLDIILTERHIICKNKGIRLECIVDGKPMSFLRELDVYSLFLNILNNAMEAVEKVECPEKRIVWLKVYTQGNLLCIQCRNYFNEELMLSRNGTYLTTKSDKKYHGFGLQSMKLITEEYGGTMSISTNDDLFSVGLAIPMP